MVQLVCTPGVEKSQGHEGVNGTLLGKPEAKLIATKADGVQLFSEKDAEHERGKEPDDQATEHQAQIRFPVRSVFAHRIYSLSCVMEVDCFFTRIHRSLPGIRLNEAKCTPISKVMKYWGILHISG